MTGIFREPWNRTAAKISCLWKIKRQYFMRNINNRVSRADLMQQSPDCSCKIVLQTNV